MEGGRSNIIGEYKTRAHSERGEECGFRPVYLPWLYGLFVENKIKKKTPSKKYLKCDAWRWQSYIPFEMTTNSDAVQKEQTDRIRIDLNCFSNDA